MMGIVIEGEMRIEEGMKIEEEMKMVTEVNEAWAAGCKQVPPPTVRRPTGGGANCRAETTAIAMPGGRGPHPAGGRQTVGVRGSRFGHIERVGAMAHAANPWHSRVSLRCYAREI